MIRMNWSSRAGRSTMYVYRGCQLVAVVGISSTRETAAATKTWNRESGVRTTNRSSSRRTASGCDIGTSPPLRNSMRNGRKDRRSGQIGSRGLPSSGLSAERSEPPPNSGFVAGRDLARLGSRVTRELPPQEERRNLSERVRSNGMGCPVADHYDAMFRIWKRTIRTSAAGSGYHPARGSNAPNFPSHLPLPPQRRESQIQCARSPNR